MALSRRSTLRLSLTGGAGLLVAGAAPAAAGAAPVPSGPPSGPSAALKRLKKGNKRWRKYCSAHPNEGRARREELVGGQDPFALVLSCSDSRVPPELVFDQGLGDLFTVRPAGQVLDGAVLGSVAYAVHHLHVPLIAVLGHTSCGAVTAAVDVHRGAPMPEGHVRHLVEGILPVVESTPDTGEDFVDDCVAANARSIADDLASDPELREYVDSGRTRVVAARYHLDSSRVEFLED
ncbi:carbonic anhydrase [Nocardiopsis chromatogenes]|uniref:carbonic anhydrase n=1 Tax=Nocardiopsis chromatogenes TaxID=280239 RepID=UPI0004769650|nr:carbonic anhydrase [Nocardiopsis chromatogenes]